MSGAIATLFGIGHLRPAPGTWGALAALPLALGLHLLGGFPALALATLAVFALGWWAVARWTRGQEDHDPSEAVIDEVAGQWLALWPVSFGADFAGVGVLALWPVSFGADFAGVAVLALWPGWVAAFLLFRLFDIWKPGPVGRADARRDALGTMLDDLVAGVFAAVGVTVLGVLWHAVIV